MIPAAITTALISLEAQVVAASPLVDASNSTIVALQLNAGNLVAQIQAALTTTTLITNIILTTDSVLLDTWTAPIDPITIVNGVNDVVTSAQNQDSLSLMRGVVGRATSNLDQLV